MRIDFNQIPASTTPCPHGGEGELTAKFYSDGARKVIPCRIQAGGSIGLHRHDSSEEICYVLYGQGIARCDGAEELLSTDVCHICPQGSEHSIVNTGLADLVLLTVVVEK